MATIDDHLIDGIRHASHVFYFAKDDKLEDKVHIINAALDVALRQEKSKAKEPAGA